MLCCIAWHKQNKKNCISCSASMCCYKKKVCCLKKNELRGSERAAGLTFKMACCWHYFTFAQRVTQFIPRIGNKLLYNKPATQKAIRALMLMNQILLCILCILSFLTPKEHIIIADITFGSYIIYLWLFENILLLAFRRYTPVNLCNPYLFMQTMYALCNRAGLLALGLVGGICFQQKTAVSIAFGSLSLLMIIID